MKGLQPLPLYAFGLLEEERRNSNYAIDTPIEPMSRAMAQPRYQAVGYPTLKDRLRNRCSDLLDIDDRPHPVFLDHSVDFLHRTVRGFLRDYGKQLRACLGKEFDPLVSLSRMFLRMLKELPDTNLRNQKAVYQAIPLTDELLYYAHEIEKRSILEDDAPLVSLLDVVDKANK